MFALIRRSLARRTPTGSTVPQRRIAADRRRLTGTRRLRVSGDTAQPFSCPRTHDVSKLYGSPRIWL